MEDNPLSALPRMDRLLAQSSDLQSRFGTQAAKAALDEALEVIREEVRSGDPNTADVTGRVVGLAESMLEDRLRVGPVRVINAAGVVVHTNLGRAPLSTTAMTAIASVGGYCDLEFDLATGQRGSRGAHCDAMLAGLTGAQDAIVVNNCAAALVLVLSVLAAGRTVPVSRGHLVEIGGSFRLPDIMAASGATLREVGTTNRTRATDYEDGEDVAALLTLHPSNFTQSGFVTEPTLSEVAAVASRRGVPLVHDAGSGLLTSTDSGPLAGETSVQEALAQGADLVLASGDKLLGGPQAGLIIGRADLIADLRRSPLNRALRLDKLRLAALNATLRDYAQQGMSSVVQILQDDPALPERVQLLAEALDGQVVQATTMIGGGSAPGVGVPSVVVALDDVDHLATALRRAEPPIITRVQDGRVLIDLRTVDPADDVKIATQVTLIRHNYLSS